MTGLDPNVIAAFSKDHAIGRILNDIRTDFIFAPQYKLLLDSIPDELWDEATGQLRSGTYNPSSLLITAEVPKPSGMTDQDRFFTLLTGCYIRRWATILHPSSTPSWMARGFIATESLFLTPDSRCLIREGRRTKSINSRSSSYVVKETLRTQSSQI